MRPFPTRRRIGNEGPSRDATPYGQAPNAWDHRVSILEARIYAAAIHSPFEAASNSNNTTIAVPGSPTTTSTNTEGGGGPENAVLPGLGDLDFLPIEVLMMVLEQCTLRTLLRVLRINRRANAMVHCLRDLDSVADTIRGNKARACGPYLMTWAMLMRSKTFQGLRQLMLSKTCDRCGDKGARLRVAKVKVLCDKC